MHVIHGLENLPGNYKNAVVCIGNFDGIHFGHQKIINETIDIAQKKSVKSLMITFDVHPRIIFAEKAGKEPIPILHTNDEKNDILDKTDLDGILYLKSSAGFLTEEPEEFLKDVIVETIEASDVIFGYDFRFGRDRKGDVELIKMCAEKYNFDAHRIGVQKNENLVISSSAIREYLQKGDLENAEKLLGRDYSFSGQVVHGSGRGRKLGFPTANIDVSNQYKLIPAKGIYFTKLKVDNDIKFGLCNIGVRPTFDETKLVIEIYIYDNHEKDLYDRQVEVVLLQWLRDEIRYESKEALIQQMKLDKKQGLQLIKKYN